MPTGAWPYNYDEQGRVAPCDAYTDIGSRDCPKSWFRKDDYTPGFERNAEFPCSVCEYVKIRGEQEQRREQRYRERETSRRQRDVDDDQRLEREQTQEREDVLYHQQRLRQTSRNRQEEEDIVEEYQDRLMALNAQHKTQWEQQEQRQQQEQLAIMRAHDNEKQHELSAAQQALQERRKASASPPADTAEEVPIRDVLLHNDDEWDVLLAQNSPDNVGNVVWAHMEAIYQSTSTANTFQKETFQYDMGDEETEVEEDEEEMDQQQMHGYMNQWQ
ncbi:hypothetical protein LQW54_002509 [Pestalotiopsis sp. IQ-011]